MEQLIVQLRVHVDVGGGWRLNGIVINTSKGRCPLCSGTEGIKRVFTRMAWGTEIGERKF